MHGTRVWFVLLAAVMLTAAGCGGSGTLPVTGTVTINGQPAANLQVDFEPKDAATGTTGTGFTGADGKYQLQYPGYKQGAPAGEYIVRITAAETDEPAEAAVAIPAKYNTESELTATVESGKSQFDFQLDVP